MTIANNGIGYTPLAEDDPRAKPPRTKAGNLYKRVIRKAVKAAVARRRAARDAAVVVKHG